MHAGKYKNNCDTGNTEHFRLCPLRGQLTTLPYIAHTLQRTRTTVRHAPVLPQERTGFEIPAPYCNTLWTAIPSI